MLVLDGAILDAAKRVVELLRPGSGLAVVREHAFQMDVRRLFQRVEQREKAERPDGA